MSRITLAPNASGTGTLTVAAPNTNTDRTLTLPDATTTLVGTDATQTLSNKTIAASQLTGALPAIDGSALTGIGSLTLLGTLATTSGSTVTLSGLNLTSYKQLQLVFKDISVAATANFYVNVTINGVTSTLTALLADTNYVSGIMNIDLGTGVGSSNMRASTTISAYSTSTSYAGATGASTAATSITVHTGPTFDSGSVTIYGVK